MFCISMSNYVSLIYVLVSWVFHNVHFRHLVQPENSISALSSTGLTKSMIFDILVMGLKIFSNTHTFSM